MESPKGPTGNLQRSTAAIRERRALSGTVEAASPLRSQHPAAVPVPTRSSSKLVRAGVPSARRLIVEFDRQDQLRTHATAARLQDPSADCEAGSAERAARAKDKRDVLAESAIGRARLT